MTDVHMEAGQAQPHQGYPPPPPPQPYAYYAPPPPAAPVAQPKTSGMAIASLVLSLLWIYGIGSVLAIIFACVAKKNIRESNGWVTGGGMATAGLVLGIIGIAVVALVIAAMSTADTSSSSSGGGYYY